MRKARSVQKTQFLAPDVQTKVIPAPTDGWDAISPLAEMDPKRAPILINWVPRPGYVELRGGSIPFADTSVDDAVESLMVHRSPTTETFFAAAGNTIWRIAASTVSIAAVTGLSNARWQYVNFTPQGAATVIQCVNGADAMRQFNGTVWSIPAITGLPVGVTTSNFINITIHKRRFWYIINNSSVAAFMPTDAITGAIAGTLDLGALWTKGGYLVAMGSWTIDGGQSPQDYAMFLSSRGQVTIYEGVDPTNASDWHLVGVFDISPPLGRRCLLRVGSDVAVITQQGVLPISQALPFDPSADRSVSITSRIQNAMAQSALSAGSNFGWQLISYPAQQLAVLNVPLGENSQQVQYVMNTLTGAWCQFIGWGANCFELFQDKLYFGNNEGRVIQAYAGIGDINMPVSADLQCAFNWFEEPGRTKRMTMIQPLLTMGGFLTPTLSVDTDFETSTAIAPVSVFLGGAQWDVALWDSSLWPSLSVNYKSWLSVEAIGHAMAVRMRVTVLGQDVGTAAFFDTAEFDDAEFDIVFSDTLPTLYINAFNSILEAGGAI